MSLNKKINSSKTKPVLVENKLKNLQVFDSSYFRSKFHFVDSDGTQNYFLFQPTLRYFKRIGNIDYVLEWKSKGLPVESIKSPSAPNNILDPSLDFLATKINVKIN